MKPTTEQMQDAALNAIELEFRRVSPADDQSLIQDMMEEPSIYRAAYHVAEEAIAYAWNEYRHIGDDSARMFDLFRGISERAREFVKQTMADGEI